MYARPKLHDKVMRRLARHFKTDSTLRPGRATALARLSVGIELGFEVLNLLGLGEEPPTALWVLLSGTPIADRQLALLTDDQRHILANARIILGEYSGRFALEDALRRYIREVPKQYRLYDFSPDRLDSQLTCNCRTELYNESDRIGDYQEILRSWLEFKRRKPFEPVKPDQIYEFRAEFDDASSQMLQVSFTGAQLKSATKTPPWFASPQRLRRSITVAIADLRRVAQYFDDREGERKSNSFAGSKPKTWIERLDETEYYAVEPDGTLSKSTVIVFDGCLNLAGMVAAGKSTLALLIAGYFVLCRKYPTDFPQVNPKDPPSRITLVVGDFMSSIRLVDLLNRFFADDPETDDPVAVPLMGQTTRLDHLRQFHASRDYQEAVRTGRIHWGERFLNPTCLLQGAIKNLDKPLVPGSEPCSRLILKSASTELSKGQKTNQRVSHHLCPFFAVCPSQRRYLDLSEAQIWVTTPGAMGSATPPLFMEKRQIRLGDIVYEQSDLVVFDESDTVMDWFDRLYAQETSLADRGKGILDKIHQDISPYWAQHRLLEASESRWIQAQNNVMLPLGHILKQLDGHDVLREWLSHGYFTARGLFYRLSRRLLGMKEYEDAQDDHIRLANEQAIAPLLAIFDTLFEGDPLTNLIPVGFRQDRPVTLVQLKATWAKRQENTEAFAQLRDHLVYRLEDLMQRTMTTGDSTQNPAALNLFINWITEVVPDTEDRQALLKAKLAVSDNERDHDYEVDTLETLAQRLELTLNAALLDRHNRIIFYEWHNRPNQVVKGIQPHRRVPSSLLDILPLPPSGRMFGIYYWHTGAQTGHRDVLSSFAYTNIGREYVLRFHELRCWLDGQPGPNTLLMSGTSYLPDSTRLHVGNLRTQPNGLLRPHLEYTTIHQAIEQSRFAFIPQYDDENQPIRVSGPSNKLEPLSKMIWRLTERKGGILGSEPRDLERLAEADPAMWEDRARSLIYVNSYEQAEWCARQMIQRWPEFEKYISYLVRAKEYEDGRLEIASFDPGGQIIRGDIEQFALTGKRIMIAPLQSVGRGFNILNSAGKAAFGAVYFLVRPMPHPFDTPAILQELNRRTLDWAADEDFEAWKVDGIYRKGVALRQHIEHYWSLVEERQSFSTLWDEPKMHLYPRRDIAATTAGIMIQAVGRLLRGGVPFHAYFVDAAWAPQSAIVIDEGRPRQVDTSRESLLVAMIEVLADYVSTSRIGEALYRPFLNRLEYTENLNY